MTTGPDAQACRSAEWRTPEAGRGRPQNHPQGRGIEAREPRSRSVPGRVAGSIPAGLLLALVLLASACHTVAPLEPDPPAPRGAPASVLDTVVRVVDGDTIVTLIGPVRLVGVDTPETHHPNKPVQKCGPEAEAFTRHELEGKKVRLELRGKDYYGRNLAYVWRGRWLFNLRLVEHGWSAAYRSYAHPRMAEFREAEARAQQKQVGLWNPKGCRL